MELHIRIQPILCAVSADRQGLIALSNPAAVLICYEVRRGLRQGQRMISAVLKRDVSCCEVAVHSRRKAMHGFYRYMHLYVRYVCIQLRYMYR